MINRAWTCVAATALLCTAAPAYPACAWVLWHKIEPLRPDAAARWEVLRAFVSEEPCAKEADRQHFSSHAAPPPEKVTSANHSAREFTVVSGAPGRLTLTRFSHLCLPETIDPRSPKGGTR